jgi:SAM-dependent methyltransferase
MGVKSGELVHNGKQESPTLAYGPAYWDSVASRMELESHYLDSFLGEVKRQAHLSLLRRWGCIPATGRVLKTDLFEEAMGTDAFLGDLYSRSGIIVGMDTSEAIVDQAQHRDAARCACYVAADVRRLPFAGDAFALIISPSTLDHFKEPSDLGRSLRELAHVMEPGGKLIITLDNRQNLFDPLLRILIRMGWVPYYIGRSYTVAELCAELKAAGLVVKRYTAILHNPRLMAVAGVIIAKKLRWGWLTGLVQRAIIFAQRFERTRWCYYTGSFVAAMAVRPGPETSEGLCNLKSGNVLS